MLHIQEIDSTVTSASPAPGQATESGIPVLPPLDRITPASECNL